LTKDLPSLGGGSSTFRNVFLIDDFTASGTTFIRKKPNGKWTGKIYKFFDAIVDARRRFADANKSFPLANDVAMRVHHYISTMQARDAILERLAAVKSEVSEWFADITVSAGLLLPGGTAIDGIRDSGAWGLTENYYDQDIYEQLKAHLNPDQKDLKRGYAHCALPVVLEHNCPNNALTLLWAETDGKNDAHAMRPLFPRRHRHS
jgi:hypothetical protein